MALPPPPRAAKETLPGVVSTALPEESGHRSRSPEEQTCVERIGGAQPQSSVEETGEVLSGRFAIERELAAGAMGSVYLGRHVRLGRPVAIKVMARHLAGDLRIVERFEREAEVMSALHHPNIVEILDYNRKEDGTPYLVMEYVEGETLELYLERKGRLDVRTALALSRQIGDALVAAHHLGIVHRDLKPANVVVQRTTEGPFVKLLDFGIAKRAAKDAAFHRGGGRALTGEFEVMGTPAYMAPEQAAGKAADLDARGDQYSLAVLMYEMLTGEPPFDSEDVMDLLFRIIHDLPESLRSRRSDVPHNVDQVVQRALRKEPELRFPSIREMMAALSESELRHSLPPSLSRAALLDGAQERTTSAGSGADEPHGRSREERASESLATTPSPTSPSFPPGGTPDLRRSSGLPAEAFEGARRSSPTLASESSTAGSSTAGTSTAGSSMASTSTAPTSPGPSDGVSPRGEEDPATGSPGATSSTVARDDSLRRRTTATDYRKLARETAHRARLSASSAQVTEDLDKARGECLLGNATLALCYLRSIVERSSGLDIGTLSEDESRGWKATLDESVRLLKKVVELRIGSPQMAVRATVSPSDLGSLSGLTRDEVYVLTRVEGDISLEELVDISPFPEAQTWAAIAQLTSSGLLIPQ